VGRIKYLLNLVPACPCCTDIVAIKGGMLEVYWRLFIVQLQSVITYLLFDCTN